MSEILSYICVKWPLPPGDNPISVNKLLLLLLYVYTALYVKWPLFLSDFKEIWILTDFRKYSNIKFHEYSSSGGGGGPELFRAGGRTDGRTDMTKLTVDFRNFTNASKNSTIYICPIFAKHSKNRR
jgi:hypothetical protein